MNLYEIFDGDGTWWLAASDPANAGSLVAKAMADSGYEQEDVVLADSHKVRPIGQKEAEEIAFHGEADGPDNMWRAFNKDVEAGDAPCVVACSEWD